MKRPEGETPVAPERRLLVPRRDFLVFGAAVAADPETTLRTLALPLGFRQEQPIDPKTQLEARLGIKIGILTEKYPGRESEFCRISSITPCEDIPGVIDEDRLNLVGQAFDLASPHLYRPAMTEAGEAPLHVLLANISLAQRATNLKGAEMLLKYTDFRSTNPLAKIIPIHELVHLNDPVEVVPATSSEPERWVSPWYERVYEAIGGSYNAPPRALFLEASRASTEVKKEYPYGIENNYDQMDPEEFYRKYFKQRLSYALTERFPREFVAFIAEQLVIFGNNLYPRVLSEVIPKGVDKMEQLAHDILQRDYPEPFYRAA